MTIACEICSRASFADSCPVKPRADSIGGDAQKRKSRQGGYKESGWGREMGEFTLNNYLEAKAVTTAL